MPEMQTIGALVRAANPQRHVNNLQRRTIKLVEEIGEVAEAWLNVTSASNAKHKTWDDVREEIADCLIVAFDVAWTLLPGETTVPPLLSGWDAGGWDAELTDYSPEDDFTGTVFEIVFDIAQVGQLLGHGAYHRARIHINRTLDRVSTLAMLPLPDQASADSSVIVAQLHTEVSRKLVKWADNRSTMQVSTDDV